MIIPVAAIEAKRNTSGVLVFGGESKKEGVDSELARRRVSKFY